MPHPNPHDNTSVLKDFVKTNNLQNKNSIINFHCSYYFENTKGKSLTEDVTARIQFDGYDNYGTFELQKYSFDPKEYAAGFNAKYQDFKMEETKLVITGKHPFPAIGEYKVIITAGKKVNELL